MRRPRRHRWLTVSVFFIAYSVLQAVFTSSNASEPASDVDLPEKIEKIEKVIQSTPEGTTKQASDSLPSKPTQNPDEVEQKITETDEMDEDEDNKKKMKDAGYKEDEEMKKEREIEKENDEKALVATVHPLRKDCTPPAIEQFPKPLMGQSARKHGGLIIHILVAVFTFIGLAIVCDEYFVSSLDRICEELQLAPDVAGATFMAAGSSAPELATVVIGVFCAQDDIGVSGVIGSAVFNIMFVISVCALCAGTVSHLNWWPLCRDCFFYALSILVMLCTIANGFVSWPEALFMLIMYGVYCVALRFNTALERWAMTLPLPFKLPTREEQAALVTYNYIVEGVREAHRQLRRLVWKASIHRWRDRLKRRLYKMQQSQATPASAQSWQDNQGWGQQQQQQPQQQTTEQNSAQTPTQKPQQQQQPPQPAAPTYYKAKEYNPETAVDPLVKPIGANHLQLACWYVAYPIHWSCRHTMPDCRGRWYPITFIVSMLWISFYSYFMVWMITIIGLVYSTLSLFSTVIFLVVATHANGWKLDRKYGAVLMVWYVLFITFASLYELNVFGMYNPPDCISTY
ncbi:unnamed protein product [Diatraea saccharalis]|uniref:Sodium/calcium exchanger membrane region domain-containing protein n=1 Tax=Diatraea saccharalis TaxID=40085 RepID=A0A9N9WK54_9NEOP|nr:unnamed protein product [Diatraea saccharalis]